MRRLAVAYLSLLLLAAAGCGVEGNWRMKSVMPRVGHEGLTVARASFYPDHSFEAVMVEDCKTIKSKGTYEYDAWHDTLTLVTGGKTVVYKAFRKSCVRLKLEECSDDGEVITVVMKQYEKCSHHPREDDDHGSCCCRLEPVPRVRETRVMAAEAVAGSTRDPRNRRRIQCRLQWKSVPRTISPVTSLPHSLFL
jgi:hypothetical protein